MEQSLQGWHTGRDTVQGQLCDTQQPFCRALGTESTVQALGCHVEPAKSTVGQKPFPKDAVLAGERPSVAGTPRINLGWFASQAQLAPYKWSVGLSGSEGCKERKERKK